jgi:hypothetical protein
MRRRRLNTFVIIRRILVRASGETKSKTFTVVVLTRIKGIGTKEMSVAPTTLIIIINNNVIKMIHDFGKILATTKMVGSALKDVIVLMNMIVPGVVNLMANVPTMVSEIVVMMITIVLCIVVDRTPSVDYRTSESIASLIKIVCQTLVMFGGPLDMAIANAKMMITAKMANTANMS